MKNFAIMLLLAAAIFFTFTTTRAQTLLDTDKISGYMDLLPTDLATMKAEIIRKQIALTKTEADRFWRLYKRYDTVLMALNTAKSLLARDYARNYDRMTSANTKELADRALDLDEKRLLVKKKFYHEFMKAVSPKAASRFFQLDRSFEILMDLQVAADVSLAK